MLLEIRSVAACSVSERSWAVRRAWSFIAWSGSLCAYCTLILYRHAAPCSVCDDIKSSDRLRAPGQSIDMIRKPPALELFFAHNHVGSSLTYVSVYKILDHERASEPVFNNFIFKNIYMSCLIWNINNSFIIIWYDNIYFI